ncbi:MAG: DUF1989 domain-containing protein [Marmoricola sp.]
MSYAHTIPGGAAWSAEIPAGSRLTLTAEGPSSMATMLLFAADRLDRLNIPDTMKAQMSACIKPPMVLMSDRGTALASVVSASTPWHDCLTGLSHDAHLQTPSSYASDRNGWRRSARTMVLLELAKFGLAEADLHAPVNWFVTAGIRDDSRASFAGLTTATRTGDTVVLRSEQDVLVVLATGPHPFAPSGGLDAVTVAVGASPASDSAASRAWREESARALAMAERVEVSR